MQHDTNPYNLSTSLWNTNYTTLWNVSSLQQYSHDRNTAKCHWLNMLNALIKHVTSSTRTTVRNDLVHEHEHTHRVSKPAHVLINLCRTFATSCTGINSFMHRSPNVAINRITVQAVGRTHVWSNEFWSLTTKQFHCLMCTTMSRSIVLLKVVNFISNASGGWQ